MKKRMALFLMALSAAAMLSGCKSTPKETEPATTEAPAETEPVTQAPTTEPPTETEKQDSMNKTRELKGLVKASDENTLTIQTERGKELKFTVTGADIQVKDGIKAGNNVTILYKGKVSDTDTSGAKVLMITELAAGETPVTEGELQTEAEAADPEAGAGTLEGTIEDLNTDRIVVLANDGNSYYFSMYETKINLVNGMKQGNYVTVDYNGDIHGPDLVPATAITDNEANGASVTAGPSKDGKEYSYISGTIESCGMSTVTIVSDDGETLSFDTSEATQCYKDGIASGSYITIEYTGKLNGADTTGVKATAVYDHSEEAAAPQDAGADNETDAGSGENAEDGNNIDEGSDGNADAGSDENAGNASGNDEGDAV